MSKKTIIVSATVATLILIIALAVLIWLRMMKMPLELETAAKTDQPAMMQTDAGESSPAPVVRMKMPTPPPPTPAAVSPAPQVVATVPDAEPSDRPSALIPEKISVPATEEPIRAEEETKAEMSPEPEPPPMVEPDISNPPQPSETLTYTLQVGAFLDKKNAEERLAILNQLGLQPYTFDVMDGNGTQWYTVRVGHYESQDTARQELMAFRKTSPFEAVVISKDTFSPR